MRLSLRKKSLLVKNIRGSGLKQKIVASGMDSKKIQDLAATINKMHLQSKPTAMTGKKFLI